MQMLESVSGMRSLAGQWQREARPVALIATSGALHAGHAALIAAAKARAAVVVVSIFPNPLAFGPSENFAGHPRPAEEDLKLCTDAGVDAVFRPGVDEMLPRGF